GPASLGGPLADEVAPLWRHTGAPYGPAFMGLAGVLAGLTRGELPAGLYGMRCVALLGVALMAAALPRLARHCGADPAVALWLGVLNPLVLLHLVAGAHNDAIMLGLLGIGLVAALGGRFALGAVLVTLAALVKAPAALGLVAVVMLQHSAPGVMAGARPGATPGALLGVAARARSRVTARARSRVTAGARLGVAAWARLRAARGPSSGGSPRAVAGARAVVGVRGAVGRSAVAGACAAPGTRTVAGARAASRPLAAAAAKTLAVSAATTVAVTAATGTGYGWISALSTPVSPQNWALTSLLGRATGALLTHAGSDLAPLAVPAWHALGLVITAALVAVIWWRLRPRPVYALGLSLAAIAAFGPAIRPWYALWGLFLIAAAAPDSSARHRTAVAVAGVLALAVLPDGDPADAGQVLLAVSGGALAIVVLWQARLASGPLRSRTA
ncbi:MAG TPA: polyprenol phosphomannose-dependent alpha 1,6 mannosyltransferase MptB, partial [Streptomyces sp.]